MPRLAAFSYAWRVPYDPAADPINLFLERLAAAAPDVQPRVLDRLEFELRTELGGRRIRIPRQPATLKEIGLRLGLIDPASLPARTWRRYRP